MLKNKLPFIFAIIFFLCSFNYASANQLYYYDVYEVKTTYKKVINLYGKPNDVYSMSIKYGCTNCDPIYNGEWLDGKTGKPIQYSIINGGNFFASDYDVGTVFYRVNHDGNYYLLMEVKINTDGKKYFETTDVDFIEDKKEKGSLIESNKILDDSYPVNGIHDDGYYYVRKSAHDNGGTGETPPDGTPGDGNGNGGDPTMPTTGGYFDWSFFWGLFEFFLKTAAPFVMLIVAITAVGLLIYAIISAVRAARR